AAQVHGILPHPPELLPQSVEFGLHRRKLHGFAARRRPWIGYIARANRFDPPADPLQWQQKKIRQQSPQKHGARQRREEARRKTVKRGLQDPAQQYGPYQDLNSENRWS